MRYADTFEKLIGRVKSVRPNCDHSIIAGFLNDRTRTLLDRRPIWAGLLKWGVISIPAQYNTGTVAMTTGSSIVTGTSTNWPVSDKVNTTLVDAVRVPGNQFITLASTAGITLDSILYVGGGTANAEIVPVLDVLPGVNKIQAIFANTHDSAETVTQSSLAGLQFRMTQINPVWSVRAVTSSTQLTLDSIWGQASQSGIGYQIILMYTTFDPQMKSLLNVIDPQQNMTLAVHCPQEYLNELDANRSATNSPFMIGDLGPSPNGSMLYEIYPPPTIAYQLSYLGYMQWPDMRFPGDRPPPFINPSTIVYGAMADALRLKFPMPNYTTSRGDTPMTDPFYNPEAAAVYESKFETGYGDAVISDNELAQTMLSWDFRRTTGISGGANFQQSHDWSAMIGDY